MVDLNLNNNWKWIALSVALVTVALSITFNFQWIENHITNIIQKPDKPPKPIPIPDDDTQPEPTPTPVEQDKNIIMVGDVSGSTVYNAIKKENADWVVVLGDWYGKQSWLESSYGSLGNKFACVVGNHEAANEDGSSSLEKAALKLCGNDYYVIINHVLFVGLNSNGDLKGQAAKLDKLITTDFLKDITSVHIMTHKPCKVPPNSHHGVEISTFCKDIASIFSKFQQKVFYNSGHNHVMSSSADGTYKQTGAGGKSHYTCGTNTEFTFCNNKNYGYLKYTIKEDGTTTWAFYDTNGEIVK